MLLPNGHFVKMFKCRDWLLCVASFLLLVVVCEGSFIKNSDDENAAVFKATVTEKASVISEQLHPIGRVEVLTENEKQAVVDRHNYLRRGEGASNMQKIKWNEYLADMAAEWVSGCVFKHGHPPRDPKDRPFKYIGQNLFYISARKDLVWGTDGYFDEKKYFTYDTNSCEEGKVCGHYTQVVWSSTTDIGCAIAFCNSSKPWWFHACNYGPGGNVITIKPYKKGPACSKCSDSKWCEDGLCKRGCNKSLENCECSAVCENCATVDPENCTCQCKDGWQGPECDVQCIDIERCKGFGHSYCPKSIFVRLKCPVMCGFCKASNATVQPTCEANRITEQNNASNSDKEFQVQRASL